MDIYNIKNLSCGYGKEEIIKNVSLNIQQGEFIGIIGPNGSGKTTLFRAICGIIKPSKGNVLYKNKNLLNITSREIAREVSVIPQLLETPFSFSVEEFIMMGRFPHSGRFFTQKQKDWAVLENVINMTDISALRNRKISELSGGERQRVIVAQGFMQEPILMLLDEPTAHLDITHQIQIMDLLKRFNKKNNLTIIIVLHDLNLAGSYCDRLILLNHGEIFKEGTPQEVLTYQNIEHVYSTTVIVKENPLNNKPYIFLVSQEDFKIQEKQ
jgi:iron complex transport system ATP-binding protein